MVPSAFTAANAGFAAATISLALLPSTRSAFSPLATAVALVENGATSAAVLPLGGGTLIVPAGVPPSDWERNTLPPVLWFSTKKQGPRPLFQRQPELAAPPAPSPPFGLRR